jgi:hypothetical protein
MQIYINFTSYVFCFIPVAPVELEKKCQKSFPKEPGSPKIHDYLDFKTAHKIVENHALLGYFAP